MVRTTKAADKNYLKSVYQVRASDLRRKIGAQKLLLGSVDRLLAIAEAREAEKKKAKE